MNEEIPQDVVRVLKQIINSDKTPEYDYSSDQDDYFNALGQEPPVGERWMTPREICKRLLAEIEVGDQ